jgi:hypothetical protein
MARSAQQIADHQAKLDRFAELLSLDIPMPTIAERLGIGRGAAHHLLAELRAKYGWQAQ